MRALPGVTSAGAIDILPLDGGGSTQPIAVEGQPVLAMSEQPEVAVRAVEPGYIETMRIRLLQGRLLNSSDIADRPAVILVSESMARRFWPGENPIGKRLTMSFFPDKSREVVGWSATSSRMGWMSSIRWQLCICHVLNSPHHLCRS